jgi:hypothetical protein
MSEQELTPVADQKYEKLVESAKALLETARVYALEFYWEVGKLAQKSGTKTYGAKTIDTFAEDIGWDRSNVYHCILFCEKWPEKADLKRAVQAGLTWTHIRALSNSKLSDTDRAELETKVQDDKIGANELKRIVKDRLEGQKDNSDDKDDSDSSSVSDSFDRVFKVAERMLEMLGTYVITVDGMKNLSGRELSDAQKSHSECVQQLELVKKSIVSALKK